MTDAERLIYAAAFAAHVHANRGDWDRDNAARAARRAVMVLRADKGKRSVAEAERQTHYLLIQFLEGK